MSDVPEEPKKSAADVAYAITTAGRFRLLPLERNYCTTRVRFALCASLVEPEVKVPDTTSG